MTVSFLEERVDALLSNLRSAVASFVEWQQARQAADSQTDERLSAGLWKKMEKQLGTELRTQIKRVGELQTQLQQLGDEAEIETAWESFAKLQDKSSELFADYLQVVEGIAFRTTGVDEHGMCYIADQLIEKSALDWYGESWAFLTVPSVREAICRSPTGLSPIRFPEWTLWTLPFVAYVLGLEVVEEDAELQTLANSVSAPASPPEDPAAGVAARAIDEKRFRSVLIADAFATFVMGPAYACAAIRVRCDPGRAYIGRDSQPEPDVRAQLILATLREMNQEGGRVVDGNWQQVADDLQAGWLAAVEQAKAPKPPAHSSLAGAIDARELVDLLDERLTLTARYTTAKWLQAQRLVQAWEAQLKDRHALTVPREADEPLTTLPDALNAAWLLRSRRPDSTEGLSDLGPALCKRILDGSRSDQRVSVQTSGRAN